MQRTPIEAAGCVLSGATMGTEWKVVLDADLTGAEVARLQADLQAAVEEVDAQMSTWTPDSDLMRFNAAPVGPWVDLPASLLTVLEAGLSISQQTGGAFEMNLGDAVRAWGFGAGGIDLGAIRAASAAARVRAVDALEVDRVRGAARKTAALALDLSGIAKGFGVDRLAEVLIGRGYGHALCAIDGEVRALGARRDGRGWSVGIDAPDGVERGGHSRIALVDAAVATSGDYRHFVMVRDRRLSHTMNPRTRAPVVDAPSSVTVMGPSCMLADAMATAMMVMGRKAGLAHARAAGMPVLFLTPEDSAGTGIFDEGPGVEGLGAEGLGAEG